MNALARAHALLQALSQSTRVSADHLLDNDFTPGGLCAYVDLYVGDHSILIDDRGVRVEYLTPDGPLTPDEAVALGRDMSAVAELVKALEQIGSPAVAQRVVMNVVTPDAPSAPEAGSWYADLRQRLGVSLAEVEQHSGLRADVLAEIEAGRLGFCLLAGDEVLEKAIRSAARRRAKRKASRTKRRNKTKGLAA